jgi:trans-aconitate methyltransferase
MADQQGWQAAGSERFRPVIAFMSVQADDRLLEIGCGNGACVEMICPLLDTGSIVAIDRSEKMIVRAESRNARNIASGKAAFVVSALDAFRPADRFGKVFAVNVNLFWIDPRRELDAVRGLLAPGGALFLFFQPPAGSDVFALQDKLRDKLEASAFRIVRQAETRSPGIVTACVEARPERPQRAGGVAVVSREVAGTGRSGRRG